MGRKIPGKKHRTVKDPYKQHALRYSVIKNKINKTPLNPDDQPIPKSVLRLMKLKEQAGSKSTTVVKNHSIDKKITKKKIKNVSIKKKQSNPIKNLKRLKGESAKSFSSRIHEGIKLLRNEATLKEVNKIPEYQENGGEEKFRKRKKRKNTDEPRLTKSQKKTIREKEKRDHVKEMKTLDKKYLIQHDVVKFGEIVHEPPTLNIKPRKATTIDGAPRPARKDLLLNKLFNNRDNSISTIETVENHKAIIMDNSGMDLKGKRKNLPNPIRKNLEQSQKDAINAYRNLRLTRAKDS